jgi:hypothetical protein
MQCHSRPAFSTYLVFVAMPTTTQPLPAPSTDDVFNLTQACGRASARAQRLTAASFVGRRATAPHERVRVRLPCWGARGHVPSLDMDTLFQLCEGAACVRRLALTRRRVDSPQPAQRVEARSPRERKPKRCFCCGDDVCSAALAHQDAPGTEAPRGGLQPKRTRCDGGRRHEAR